MSAEPLTPTAAPAPARLMIHAGPDPASHPASALARALQHLPMHALQRLQRRAPTRCAAVQIDDLRGRRFFDAEQAPPLIEVPLPAGTYHVTVDVDHLRRRYTVTLETGATFHLHLPSDADPH